MTQVLTTSTASLITRETEMAYLSQAKLIGLPISKTHETEVKGRTYTVDKHYLLDSVPIGSGAYGDVCSAYDTKFNKKVVIKKITNVFHDLVDAKRILREIKMLSHFSSPKVVSMLDMIPPTQDGPLKDIYMVLDQMDTDLNRIIRDKKRLSEEHIQYFTYQMLCGLKYIHSCGIIHRDIKPSNILVNLKDCSVKICDFGLARPKLFEADMTEYVVTRWYRAPEVILANRRYDEKVDLWSLGCITCECYRKTPLFRGKNYIEQLNLMFDLLGTTNHTNDIEWIEHRRARQFVQNAPYKKAKPFEDKCIGASQTAISFMRNLVVFNPNKRYSVNEAICHPFCKPFRDVKSEIISNQMFNFDYEDKVDTKDKLANEMYKEIGKSRKLCQNEYRQFVLSQKLKSTIER